MHDLKTVSAEQWKRLSERTVYFGHQSVGANIVEGIREIEAANPQIRLRVSSGERTAASGVLNEFYIGRNEDPDSKNDAFVTATRGAIGEQPVLMFKYCYVDVDEKTDPKKLFARYRETVEKLRAQQPNATILHVTLPLMTEPSLVRVAMNRVRGLATHREENAIRQQYNELLRATYGGKEPVFDLAAIESTRSDGTLEYGTMNGKAVPALAREWSTDGGHLNEAGRRRVAEQLLVTLATLR